MAFKQIPAPGQFDRRVKGVKVGACKRHVDTYLTVIIGHQLLNDLGWEHGDRVHCYEGTGADDGKLKFTLSGGKGHLLAKSAYDALCARIWLYRRSWLPLRRPGNVQYSARKGSLTIKIPEWAMLEQQSANQKSSDCHNNPG